MPHDFILQRTTISICTLSKEKYKKTIICVGWYLHPVQMTPATSEGGRHICTGPRLRPVQM
jgi:hypothetical protein